MTTKNRLSKAGREDAMLLDGLYRALRVRNGGGPLTAEIEAQCQKVARFLSTVFPLPMSDDAELTPTLVNAVLRHVERIITDDN